MSFKDIRKFTELLRVLGCPQKVSLESFRNPNFPLLTKILVWLVNRLDDEIELPIGPFENEQDRILLIRTIGQNLAVKMNLKLNTKNLYSSDGYAVRELLKVAMLLKNAIDTATSMTQDDSDGNYDEFNLDNFDINDKIVDLKRTRQLASEITSNGAALYNLLGKEVNLRAQRQKSIAKQLEISTVELDVKNAIENLNKEKEKIKQEIENVSATESSLDQRIERKKSELERSRNRLQTLEKVRPAFLDEFSALEKELKILYAEYVSKHRTMIYLENLVEIQERTEALRAENEQEKNRKLTEKLNNEDKIITDIAELPEEDEENIKDTQKNHEIERLRVKTSVIRPKTGGRINSRVYGSMNAASSNSDSSLTTSDSDSEDILLNEDDFDDFNVSGVPRRNSDINKSFGIVEEDIGEIEIHQPPKPPPSSIRRSSTRLNSRMNSSHQKLKDIEDDF